MSANDTLWKGNVGQTRLDVEGTEHYDERWKPMSVRRREPSVVVRESYCGVPSWEEVVFEGAEACGSDVDLAPASDFTAGRFQDPRCNVALRHLRIEEGEPVVGAGGVLGERFDRYFVARYSKEEQLQIIADYQNGFDVERHMSAEFLAEMKEKEERRARERAASADGRAEPEKVRRHANICRKKAFVTFMMMTVMGYLGTGAVECLGLTTDIVGTAADPLCRGTFTIEEGKPRLCYNPAELNAGTEGVKVKLDGIEHVVDACLRTQTDGTGFGKTLDEQSGYHHHMMSERSRRYLAFDLFGYTFQWRCLPFGYQLGTYVHQFYGNIATGFLRSVGLSLSQYIDDHPVTGLHGRGDLVSVNQAVFALLMVKGRCFGYHFSQKKCALEEEPRMQFEALGLEPDRGGEVTRVPVKKQEKFAAMGNALLVGLRLPIPSYIPRLLAQFIGLAMYLAVALRGVRVRLSSLYAGLTGRDLHFDRQLHTHGWWRDDTRYSRSLRAIDRARQHLWTAFYCSKRARLVDAMIADICALMTSVAGNACKLWRLVGVHGPVVVCSIDSTLWQWGMKVRKLSHGGGCGRALSDLVGDVVAVAGGSFPDLFSGVDLRRLATGCMELCGVLMTLLGVESCATLCAYFCRRVTTFRIDNQEVWWMLVTGRVTGLYSLEKRVLLLAVYAVIERLDIVPTWVWVSSKDNEDADEPSRAERYRSVRLRMSVYAALRGIERCTLDAFSSLGVSRARRGSEVAYAAEVQKEDGWEAVPYYSMGLDHGSLAMDALAQNVAEDAWVYAFPPAGMIVAAADWLVVQKARGILVLSAEAGTVLLLTHPWNKCVVHQLGNRCLEWRSQYEWEPWQEIEMLAVEFDFGRNGAKRLRVA